MIPLLMLIAAILAVAIVLTTFVQLLYLESMRLRAHSSASLELFKESIEDRIGLHDEAGALAFSLLKHGCLLALGAVLLAISLRGVAAAMWQAMLETVLIGGFLMLATAYIIPQLLYRKTSGRWLIGILGVVRLLRLLVRPVTAVLGFLQSLFELGDEPQATDGNGDNTEDIDALISAGAEEGIIEEGDRKLIQSVVEFGDKIVREVMTPRPDIVAIEMNRPLDELRELAIKEQYSRLPVYEGTIDQMRGFVHVRDMFELGEAERARRKVKELIREVRLIPEAKKVDDLLREMQTDGVHMAIVVDEYGQTAGLATLEDLVEEVFGEIRDEHEPGEDYQRDAFGRLTVSGSFHVDRLEKLTDFRPADDMESTTVGGLASEWFGRVPEAGESIARGGILLEILSANNLRVEQVRVTKQEKESDV
jgi:putative hemolysin